MRARSWTRRSRLGPVRGMLEVEVWPPLCGFKVGMEVECLMKELDLTLNLGLLSLCLVVWRVR